jgi:hypothetical protein
VPIPVFRADELLGFGHSVFLPGWEGASGALMWPGRGAGPRQRKGEAGERLRPPAQAQRGRRGSPC